jgi:integrase
LLTAVTMSIASPSLGFASAATASRPVDAEITFAYAAGLYVKAGGERRFLWVPKQHIGNVPLASVTQALIDRTAKVAFPAAKVSTRVRQYYVPVAAVLHHAAEAGLCAYLQVRRPSISCTPRLRWIWPAESERLANACSGHFRPLYLFLQYTGAYPAEAVFLDWKQVDCTYTRVSFVRDNDAEERTVAMPEALVAALDSLPHRSGAVFRRPDGQPYTMSGRAASAVKTAFVAACRRAQVRDFTLRDVRTTWCMWQLAGNRDFKALERLAGWRDARALDRYKKVPAAQLDALHDAIRAHGMGMT